MGCGATKPIQEEEWEDSSVEDDSEESECTDEDDRESSVDEQEFYRGFKSSRALREMDDSEDFIEDTLVPDQGFTKIQEIEKEP